MKLLEIFKFYFQVHEYGVATKYGKTNMGWVRSETFTKYHEEIYSGGFGKNGFQGLFR